MKYLYQNMLTSASLVQLLLTSNPGGWNIYIRTSRPVPVLCRIQNCAKNPSLTKIYTFSTTLTSHYAHWLVGCCNALIAVVPDVHHLEIFNVWWLKYQSFTLIICYMHHMASHPCIAAPLLLVCDTNSANESCRIINNQSHTALHAYKGTWWMTTFSCCGKLTTVESWSTLKLFCFNVKTIITILFTK